jgi:hypothetical protein
MFGGDGHGWRSSLRTIRCEYLRELAQAMANDVSGPNNGFCVWESFRNADYCHLAFDIDLKPSLPAGKKVKDLVAALSRAVASAFAANFVQRRPTRFDCIVWCASRVGKASYHVHYYRLRLSFAEQLCVARWVREALSKDAALAWLFVAMDVGPNERGHLRTPLSHKFDDGELLSGSCLMLDGVYDRAGDPVPEVRRDRCFWHESSGVARLALLVEACFHTTSRAEYHDVMEKEDASGARKSWVAARARAAARVRDVAADSGDEAEEVPLTGLDMCDWREETMVPRSLMVVLSKRLATDDDPYERTLRWFAQRVAVVGNALYYKVLDKTRMPTLEHHRLEEALYAQYPKVVYVPAGSDKAKSISFLKYFVEACTVREHYRDLIMVPRGVLETERVDAQGKLNQWTGWRCDQWAERMSMLDSKVDDLAMDDANPIHFVLFYIYYDLCNSVEEHFKAVLWYLGHLVQCPSEKTGRILVIYGPEGSGKSGLFVDLFLQLILGARHAVVLNSASDITGTFNSLLDGRIVCVAEEAMLSDARSADVLKDLVTGDTITINRKMVAQRQDTNYLNVILLSNNEVPLVVGKEARRPIIVKTTDRFSSMGEEEKFAYFDHRAAVFEQEKTALQFGWFLSRLDLTEWARVRKSKLFFSREFDAMRVASLSPGLKLAFDIINAGSAGSSSALNAVQGPPGWWTRTVRSPWFEQKVKEYGGESHSMQQSLIKLGCSFGTADGGAQFIEWPPKEDFRESFCKLVPGLDPERLNVAPAPQDAVPTLSAVGPTTDLFKKMRPLTCEKARSLERAHSMAEASQSAATPPASPFRPRPRRPRVVDDPLVDDLPPPPPPARSPPPPPSPHQSQPDEAMETSPPRMDQGRSQTDLELLF